MAPKYDPEGITWLKRAVRVAVNASDHNTRVPPPNPNHHPEPADLELDVFRIPPLFNNMQILPENAWEAYALAQSWRAEGAIPDKVLDELERIGETIPSGARNIRKEDKETKGICWSNPSAATIASQTRATTQDPPREPTSQAPMPASLTAPTSQAASPLIASPKSPLSPRSEDLQSALQDTSPA